jgi:hypothetical protein
MNCKKCFALSLIAVAGFSIVASIAIAEPSKDSKPAAGQPEMQLPPGWTAEDMQACMASMTPGKMHEHLAKSVGVWQGKNTVWIYPGAEPTTTDSTATITPMLGGRFIKCEMAGEMPGMGPYNGFAIYGFDNVSQKFVSTWVDNCGTGMANGIGDLSSDGKTLTWNFAYNCPLTKRACELREIETFTGPNSKTLEMFATDPKSGKEYKMMELVLTRKPGTEGTAAAPTGTR